MTLEEVAAILAEWIALKKTGSVQANFFKGGISNVNLTQCIKTEKEGGCNENQNSRVL